MYLFYTIKYMKTSELVVYFKSIQGIANFFEISRDSVYKWGDEVPESRQFELEVKTNGALKSDYTLKKELENKNDHI